MIRLAFCLVIALFSTGVGAQTYPEYDGIYVFDEKRASWVEVQLQDVGRIGIAQSSNSVKDPRFLSNEAAGVYNLMSIPRLSATVANIHRSTKLRLYVRGRNPTISSIVYLVDAIEMASTVPSGAPTMSDGTQPGAIFDARGNGTISPELVVTSNGRQPGDFRTKIVDDFSSEYILDPWGDKILKGFKGCTNCQLAVRGFAVLVPGSMLTGDAQTAYVVKVTEP